MKKANARSIARLPNARPIPTGTILFSFTNTSTPIRAGAQAQVIRLVGQAWSPKCCSKAANRVNPQNAKEPLASRSQANESKVNGDTKNESYQCISWKSQQRPSRRAEQAFGRRSAEWSGGGAGQGFASRSRRYRQRNQCRRVRLCKELSVNAHHTAPFRFLGYRKT